MRISDWSSDVCSSDLYDACISDYLSSLGDDGTRSMFPGQANGSFIKVADLRYGENPHQRGAFYRDLYPVPGTLATFVQLQGKELSYNNMEIGRASCRERVCQYV